MKIVKFFDADYVKSRATMIDENVDSALVNQAILNAQDLRIRSILNDDLYKKISSMVEDGSISTNSNYKTLMEDFIVIALLKWTIVELSEMLRYKFRNTSILMDTTPNTENVEFNEFKWKIARLESDATYYSNLLKQQLVNHSNLYPEYLTETEQELNPLDSSFSDGIYTGRRGGCSFESKCNRDR